MREKGCDLHSREHDRPEPVGRQRKRSKSDRERKVDERQPGGGAAGGDRPKGDGRHRQEQGNELRDDRGQFGLPSRPKGVSEAREERGREREYVDNRWKHNIRFAASRNPKPRLSMERILMIS